MKATAKANAIVFTQGGPTPVINASWVGVLEGLKGSSRVGRVMGAMNGVDGIIKQNLVDLTAQSASGLEQCVLAPASALYTTRHKPSDEECAKVLDVFRRQGIRFVFGIGGNDTSETLHIVNEAAKAANYELRLFHVPKTIDCDLMENDHTPGYGSAARFVARAFMGVDLDNQCFGGIYLGVCMGRHAGFLAAASAICRQDEDDGPHLVYVPERPFEMEKFLADVYSIYDRTGRCVIAVSEGIETPDHKPVLELLQGEQGKDSHGNVQLSGSGGLSDGLMARIKDHVAKLRPKEKTRARADTLGYIQRSYPDQSEVDRKEAREVGRFAAKMALSGDIDGSVTIKRDEGKRYKVRYELVDLALVAGKTRRMPSNFINAEGNNVTQAFVDWARPLVGPLSPRPKLKMKMMPPK